MARVLRGASQWPDMAERTPEHRPCQFAPPRRSEDCVLTVLRDMYNTAWRAPEAFRMEYAAATEYVVSLINLAVQLEPSAALGSSLGSGAARGEQENALHFAAGCGCIEACDLLLRWNASLNFQQDARGQTPLSWAARHGMARVCELLLLKGADPLHADIEGRLPLHVAAARGHSRICELLVSVQSVRGAVDSPCDSGHSALHLAAACGSGAACQGLVVAGADVSMRTSVDNKTPLHLAALSGNAAAAAYLASVSPLEVLLAGDASGASALQLAERSGHHDVADVLREPEDEHRRLVSQWSCMLHDARNEAQLPARAFEGTLAVDLAAPVLQRVCREKLELMCCVHDLEYRLIEYVIEVRDCEGGRQSAAPARVYFARLGEQRKVDDVAFDVPHRRPTGQSLWEVGGWYQFRIIGRCSRCSWQPLAPWQVTSEWSEPTQLLHTRSARRRALSRNGSRGRSRRYG